MSRKNTFRYLESMLQKDRDIDEDVSHRIKAMLVVEFLLLIVAEFLLSSREDDPRS